MYTENDYILGIDLGLTNFSYCLVNILSEKIIKWDRTDICKVKDTYDTMATNLYHKLQELDLLKLNDNNEKTVINVIELQPKSNIKTTVMSGQTQMYYTIEKNSNKHLINKQYCQIKKIVGYHARNKLKYYEPRDDDEPIDVTHIKNGHYKNKKLGKEQCLRVLKQNKETEWLKFFEDSKKKDDLADSYLMCLAYMKFVLKIHKYKEAMHKFTKKEDLIKLLSLDPKIEDPEKYPPKEKKLCKGNTINGKPCSFAVYKKSEYCKKHKPQKVKIHKDPVQPKSKPIKKSTKQFKNKDKYNKNKNKNKEPHNNITIPNIT